MTDLGDWIWLLVVIFWVLVRVLPRLFRSRSSSEGKPKSERPVTHGTRIPTQGSFGHDHSTDVNPKPIEPR